MTVKELIKVLETYPQEATVFYEETANELEETDIYVETIEETLKIIPIELIDKNCRNGMVIFP